MIYSLEYDLTVPEYRDAMVVSVRQIQEMSNELHLKNSQEGGTGLLQPDAELLKNY